MSEITFLCKRQQRRGFTYQVEVPTASGRMCLRVFSCKAPKRTVINRDVKDKEKEKEPDRAIEETARSVRERGGGTLVAIAEDERRIKILPCPFGDLEPPSRFGLLCPGQRFQLEALTGEWRNLSAAAHVFVPVYKEDEEALEQFAMGLERLPSDMESLVLYSLRQPSLDARVDRLEEEIRGQSEARAALDESLRGLARLRCVVRNWSRRQVARGPLIAGVLALAFGLNALMLYAVASASGGNRILRQRSSWSWSSFWPWAESKLESNPEVEALKKPIGDILSAVQQDKPRNLALAQIYKTHFKPLDEKDLGDLLASQSDERDRLILGLIRLQLLNLDPTASDTSWLNEADRFADAEYAFRRYERVLEERVKDRDLLAFLSCQLNAAAGEQAPRLPPFEDGQSGVMIVPDATCKDFSLAEGIRGLERLRGFIPVYAAGGPYSPQDESPSDTPSVASAGEKTAESAEAQAARTVERRSERARATRNGLNPKATPTPPPSPTSATAETAPANPETTSDPTPTPTPTTDPDGGGR